MAHGRFPTPPTSDTGTQWAAREGRLQVQRVFAAAPSRRFWADLSPVQLQRIERDSRVLLGLSEGDPAIAVFRTAYVAEYDRLRGQRAAAQPTCDHYWLYRRGGYCPSCRRNFRGNFED